MEDLEHAQQQVTSPVPVVPVPALTSPPQFAASIQSLADAFRDCAQKADTYAKLVTGAPDHDDSGKGKRKASDDADGPKKRKRTTKPKDPNAPKRPASSYILFQNEVRGKLKEKHPNITNSDLLAMIAEKWKQLPEEQREMYNQRMKTAKAQYSEDKKAYDNRTPEEIAAANAALAATKKVTKPRATKAAAAPATATAAPVVQAAAEESLEEDESDEGESDEDASPPRNGKAGADVSSEGEDESEPEASPEPPKKKRAASVQPTVPPKTKKMKV